MKKRLSAAKTQMQPGPSNNDAYTADSTELHKHFCDATLSPSWEDKKHSLPQTDLKYLLLLPLIFKNVLEIKMREGTQIKSSSMQTTKRQKSTHSISQLERTSRLSWPHRSTFSSLCHIISPTDIYYEVWQPPQL